RDPAMRNSHLSHSLPRYRHHAAGASDHQSGRVDMALRRHLALAPRLASGDGFSALSLGLLQRNDDDVFAGARFADLSAARGDLGCVETNLVRVRWHALYRIVCAAVCPPVFASVV